MPQLAKGGAAIKRELSPAVIIAVIVLLLLVFGVFGWNKYGKDLGGRQVDGWDTISEKEKAAIQKAYGPRTAPAQQPGGGK